MRRFPVRTLLLMTLALLAFARLYFVSHIVPDAARRPAPAEPTTRAVMPAPSPGAPRCPALEKTLERVLREPDSAPVLADARQQLEACADLPPRVCELGPALDARFPSNAGIAPPRELLAQLCARCPSGGNPCASAVIRSLMTLPLNQQLPSDVPLWHLEHAGPGTADACAEVVRSLLAPLVVDDAPPGAQHRAWLEQLVPVCARAGQVSSPLLRAVVAQGAVPALAPLVQAALPGASEGPLTPDRVLGPAGASRALDGQEATVVELTRTEDAPGWRKDGALSAVFSPPLRTLAGLRVRARGPGVLRAMVRVDEKAGLTDPETSTHFVRPLVCRFQGSGAWEACGLPVALLGVEAISVFPEQARLTVMDLELRGAR